jgi:phosphoribosylformylglycinamidine synthase
VQIGDPFTEKLLLEASLEVIRKKLLVGIQDMGAAGLTCSSTEMSARGKSGMMLDIGKVPVREEGMIPYEIMLSESQERMLVIVTPENLKNVKDIFNKWGLNAIEIGIVTNGGQVIVTSDGQTVANVPANSLVLGGDGPVYVRHQKRPAYLDEVEKFDPASVDIPADMNKTLECLLGSPNIASKRWVYEQYDTSVRASTVIGPGSSAGVLRIHKSKKGLAVTTDCNGRYCYLNPREGAKIAVAEAALNVACAGGKPVAITNCLNFGNPYDPEIYYQFAECVAGMGEACKALETPVTGGNVSFYNEDPNGAVYPTPVIGMLGILDDIKHATTIHFKGKGHDIYLIGENKDEIGGSEYLKVIHGQISGKIPAVDLEIHRRTVALVLALITGKHALSAQDISDGGLAVALAECSFANRIGAEITLDDTIRPDALLFGESQSRVIMTAMPKSAARVEELARRHHVTMKKIGVTGGDVLKINSWINAPIGKLRKTYEEAIPNLMAHVTATQK